MRAATSGAHRWSHDPDQETTVTHPFLSEHLANAHLSQLHTEAARARLHRELRRRIGRFRRAPRDSVRDQDA
jgi:hypothetical protein